MESGSRKNFWIFRRRFGQLGQRSGHSGGRQEQKEISQENLLLSIEKVMLGPERKSHALSKKEKEITAYHEAGHAMIAASLPKSDPVHKISIVSRGRAGDRKSTRLNSSHSSIS